VGIIAPSVEHIVLPKDAYLDPPRQPRPLRDLGDSLDQPIQPASCLSALLLQTSNLLLKLANASFPFGQLVAALPIVALQPFVTHDEGIDLRLQSVEG
jgi:hypothetical protein